jgi:hypothetical protein
MTGCWKATPRRAGALIPGVLSILRGLTPANAPGSPESAVCPSLREMQVVPFREKCLHFPGTRQDEITTTLLSQFLRPVREPPLSLVARWLLRRQASPALDRGFDSCRQAGSREGKRDHRQCGNQGPNIVRSCLRIASVS